MPVKTTNPLNGSWGHWIVKSKARRVQRTSTINVLAGTRSHHPDWWPQWPITVHLVRVAPSNGLDDDALPASLKSIRDGVADWLGLKDDRAPDKVTWTYDQRRGKRGEYAVEITISPRDQ